jgi:prepilin-type processing-associated H-X9-DG protein/prepilin-type N-terminal cleavage/methylation domain-containing protein
MTSNAPRPGSSTPLRRPGFTLVELLVVIGIIALLISILLPVLSRVREQGNAVKCAANLRQIAVGWLLYADGSKGSACPGRMPKFSGSSNTYDVGNGMQFRPRWFVTLGAQSKIYAYARPSPDPADDNTKTVDNPVFICPTEPERINNRNYAYGYNFQFLGNSRLKTGGSGQFINFPVKVSKVRAADTVMAADCIGTSAGKPATARTGYRIDGSADTSALGNHAWALDPPRLTANSDYCDDSNRSATNRSAPDPRHNKKANVAFCDGHVQSMTLQDLGYIVNPDGSIPVADPAAHNRLFSGNGEDRDPPSIQ